jgi:enhancer of mRNA-decapping protein 4
VRIPRLFPRSETSKRAIAAPSSPPGPNKPRSDLFFPALHAAAAVVPKGRALDVGADAVYDIENRVDGEEQPQLEVSPITMYVTEYAER